MYGNPNPTVTSSTGYFTGGNVAILASITDSKGYQRDVSSADDYNCNYNGSDWSPSFTSFGGGILLPHVRYAVYFRTMTPIAYNPTMFTVSWPGLIGNTTLPFPTGTGRVGVPFDTEPSVAPEFVGQPITYTTSTYELALTKAALSDPQTGYICLNFVFSITNTGGYALDPQVGFPYIMEITDTGMIRQTKLDPRDFAVAPGSTRPGVSPSISCFITKSNKWDWVILLGPDNQPIAQVLLKNR